MARDGVSSGPGRPPEGGRDIPPIAKPTTIGQKEAIKHPSSVLPKDSDGYGMASCKASENIIGFPNKAALRDSAARINYFRDLNTTKDIRAFNRRIGDLLERWGLSHYSFSRLATKGDMEPTVKTVPDELTDEYQKNRYYEEDFVLRHCMSNTDPIFQYQSYSHIKKSPHRTEQIQLNIDIYEMISALGFYDFYNTPIQAHNGNGNVMLAVTSKGEAPEKFFFKVEKLKPRLVALSEAIDYIGTRKFPEIFLSSEEKRETVITPRQLKILTVLAKDDLTLAEAAEQLSISIHTANQHVAAARQAFDARTTSGAIYRAIKEGLIDY